MRLSGKFGATLSGKQWDFPDIWETQVHFSFINGAHLDVVE